MSFEWYTQAIRRNFPCLNLRTIVLAGEGFDSQAFIVNGDYVFKFPKHQDSVRNIGVEVALLPKLQDHLSVAVPRFEFVADKGELPFVGYRRIEGVPLDAKSLWDLGEGLRNRLIGEIAAHMQQMQKFPVSEAVKCGVEVWDFRNKYHADLERTRIEIYPMVSAAVQDYLEDLFEKYLDNDDNFEYAPVFLHADWSPGHILYDPDTRTIVGIIDFGDAVVGDPAYDLRRLYEEYGEAFIGVFLRYYPHNDTDNLMAKLRFFGTCAPIHGAFFGIDHGSESVLRDHLGALRRRVQGC